MIRLTEDNDGQPPAPFYDVLRKSLKKRKTNIESICPAADAVARRVLEDYGATAPKRLALTTWSCSRKQ
jgi:hypothetical protein